MALEPEHDFHIEEKVLEFSVEVVDAQFNSAGRYFLKLSIQSLATKDYSRVQLKKESASEYIYDSEVITDVVSIFDATKNCSFQEKCFTFKLPKGFLKNDKNYDVFLLVEAFTLPNNDEDMGTKVGEGKVAIYPRTNAPRINVRVGRGKNMYHFTDIMTIRRTLSSDDLKMHCGRLKCVFSLREEIPPSPAPKTPPTESPDLSEFLGKQDEAEKHKSPVLPSPKPKTPVRTSIPELQHSDSPDNSWRQMSTPPPLRSTRTASPTSQAPTNEQMMESPLPHDVGAVHWSHPRCHHVASHGKERVDVLVHGATNLPTTSDGSVPQPYAILKSGSDDLHRRAAAGRTHASLHSTHTPLWEELVSLEVDERGASDEAIILRVGDDNNRQSLVTYRLPWAYLKPYHQYHLELVTPSKSSPFGIRTYVTITRKTARLPHDMASPNYCGLEVLLCAVEKPLQNPVGPIIAVARVVPDGSVYQEDNLAIHPRPAGVTLTTVTCPSPHPSSFSVPNSQPHGYPQVTQHGYPEAQPVWNHHFLFCEHREKATLFTPSAALVIEYYTASEVMSEMAWRVRSPVGYSILPLDEDVYKQLVSERGHLGLRVEGLPVQGSDLETRDNQTPTVGMVLRLMTVERPEHLASVSERQNLPVLHQNPIPMGTPHVSTEYYRNPSPEVLFVDQAAVSPEPSEDPTPVEKHSPPIPPVHTTPVPRAKSPQALRSSPLLYQQRVLKKPLLFESRVQTPNSLVSLYLNGLSPEPIKDGELPPFDAMESVLPEYQYIFVDPNQPRREPPNPALQETQPLPSDQVPSSVLDHQLKELENYRAAVHKMGRDILALREQIREQEMENSQLRRDLSHYDDSTRLILDSSDLDGVTKPELAAKYASLKQKLASQTADLKSYKDRVQKLQNEIIKKNDREKEFLKVKDAHLSQQSLMLKFQEKARKVNDLEEACRKQEKVIEKMEKLLQRQKDHKNRGNLQHDTHDALLEENRRLRREMEIMKDRTRHMDSPPNDESEKLELYQALDKAEGRIMSLEKQLADNSRRWGREKADLVLRKNETDYGFGRPIASPTLLHHSFPAPREPRRYSKAPPKHRFSPKIGSYY